MPIKLVESKTNGAKIKVIGVGGGGGNILNSMVSKGIEGVEFIAINTDAQALERSKADVKIAIGNSITNGLGAGMKEEVGFKAVEESRDEIERALAGSDMVFITAGMGGGTGTGGAPAIAHIAKGLDALVVAIVTKPFAFEGKPRSDLAISGIDKLKSEVDSLIVIPNEKILKLINKETTKKVAFELADRVLYNATKGISQIITKIGEINVDFADVRTTMKDMGDAMMGTGIATGENRAVMAVTYALSNPILDEIDIKGSRSVLVNICSNGEIKMSEIEEINRIIQESAGEDAKYILGVVDDESMKEELMVTVIATGFNYASDVKQQDELRNAAELKARTGIISTTGRITSLPTAESLGQYDRPAHERREISLNEDLSEKKVKVPELSEEELDILLDNDFKKPAFLRRQMD
ncbi:cell division protein FtsZ [soil metagenome]